MDFQRGTDDIGRLISNGEDLGVYIVLKHLLDYSSVNKAQESLEALTGRFLQSVRLRTRYVIDLY